MRAAVIDINTNIVIGVIMGDAAIVPAYDGTFLINLPEDSLVGIGWGYDPVTQQFIDPMAGA
jgi:hypothetical protein